MLLPCDCKTKPTNVVIKFVFLLVHGKQWGIVMAIAIQWFDSIIHNDR